MSVDNTTSYFVNSLIPPETATTTRVVKVNSSSGCVKCGTVKQSGKRSCCVSGGAWFKNCGNAGDPNFDHTWTEGIQACKNGFASSMKSSLRVMLSHMGVVIYPLNAAHRQNTPKQKITNIYRPDSMSNVGDMTSGECVGLMKVFVCMSVLYLFI